MNDRPRDIGRKYKRSEKKPKAKVKTEPKHKKERCAGQGL